MLRLRLRRRTVLVATGVVAIAVAAWWAEDAGWFDARAVAVSEDAAKAMLADVTRWDAATSGERRGVAEQVAARLDGFTLLRVRPFGFEGHRHEIAVFSHAATGLEFSLIPGGTFLMGSPAAEEHRMRGELQHQVTLTHAYLLARTECTQRAYERVIGTNPSSFQGPERPVEMVSWYDAQVFDARTGLRLPTEAEWEYACRAGTTTRFWSGDREEDMSRVGWYRDNLDTMPKWLRWALKLVGGGPPAPQTQAVGARAANPFGLHDIHGNVWEWCEDWFDLYPVGSVTDPTGSEDPGLRVFRGAAYAAPAKALRSAFRYAGRPRIRYGYLGFRPARSVAW